MLAGNVQVIQEYQDGATSCEGTTEQTSRQKDKEEDFFENKKSRHNQLSKPLQEEWSILKMIAPVLVFYPFSDISLPQTVNSE